MSKIIYENPERVRELTQSSYEIAKEMYKGLGVCTEKVLEDLKNIHISVHCWQGDDVEGFEPKDDVLSGGGIMSTGNYPGKAQNAPQLRADLEKALSLIPGKHRVNLHAMYGETDGEKTERNRLDTEHFARWIEWAKDLGIGLDFNPTFFAHGMADSGFTLSSKDKTIREFWIEHGKRCRKIGADMGKELGSPCVNNLWIPDGAKDFTVSRLEHRRILRDSLDEIYSEAYPEEYLNDAVESKLFGLGSESYVVGSHEFYLSYALTRNLTLCLDTGHFHPTETVSDKISAILSFTHKILLHMSRGVRWDSDHVAILSDDTLEIAREIKRAKAYENTNIALDFFDGSINRITAWVTGTRAVLKAVMISMLEPTQLIGDIEDSGNTGHRLALLEELKSLPFGAVWNKFCLDNNTPAGYDWLEQVDKYEKEVLSKR